MRKLHFSDGPTPEWREWPPPDSGYRRTVTVSGWSSGPLNMATWRKSFAIRGEVLPHSMVIWGQGEPIAACTVLRFGDVLEPEELAQGFKVDIDGSELLVQRSTSGTIWLRREVHFSMDEGRWLYRRSPPFHTELVAAETTTRLARFSPWATLVDQDASYVEQIATLTVIAQRLWLKVASPAAVAWSFNIPRRGGDGWVV